MLEAMSRTCSFCRMTKHPVLTLEAIDLISRRFAVLSEPMRLRLIHALFSGEKNVTALVEEVGGTQANISRHLQTLTNSNILSRRKVGLQVFYSISDQAILKLCELVCDSLQDQLVRQAGAFGRAPKR